MRTSPVWSPEQYGTYADERGRPFADLVRRVGAEDPRTVVDLGCGPGTLTATLLDRWPTATIHGVDSSPEMIAAAEQLRAEPAVADRLTFEVADLRDWSPAPGSIDVIVSNATLQWVPEQLDLLAGFVRVLKPGGWLAIQIPGNGDAPSHAILRELASSPPYAGYAADKSLRPDVPGPADYVEALSAEGCSVDAWETTYNHLLAGENAVLEWVKGTGARPVLQSLPDDLRARFEAEYGERLAAAYPRREYGTLLPFRRIFAVAHKTPSEAGR
ncbi:Trans-aconitate 2-methyltransferase [Kribbella flavida DSM 17836]|uniref:Trans-aconitate 2-methyltransferase n=1 Tax=Kribbella flavida (strain DSM 17836 / JCM 10339 / NBRC 14399) TaxID=479435 RepID=D2PPC6_KRIFD|nr:trans-aconitate 2-methyltransferase [Kribbella flavida]ADB34722.1 Trans-aconitate 2-methyltransferase [Kribbella flavida DSM 17836]